MKAAEDFLEVVVKAHIVAAANSISEHMAIASVHDMATQIVKSFIKLRIGEANLGICDGVYLYASDLLTLGMIWMGFHDAIREGDGDRVMTYWKFFLPIFRLLGRKNYSIEAVDIQLLHHHHLSERQSAELVWSRFVNTHGRQGKNIPCDLHLEHLNRRLKSSLRNLCSNIKGNSVVRAAKSIGIVHHICQVFEEETTHHKEYSIPASSQDFQKVINELTSLKVFDVIPGRDHESIHIKKNLLQKFDTKKFLEWVQNHIY